ncbi:hypothetical protein P7K49_012003 [Saguinus oedipus]|uniref:Uncharacterized protein n=1 Tax=Saguinus oedipus TaxID=9490 RepID=A0ABQ9VS86_SAGOE|nr:hypothetical protein P7K49_012003 [Saguinus oedipus]
MAGTAAPRQGDPAPSLSPFPIDWCTDIPQLGILGTTAGGDTLGVVKPQERKDLTSGDFADQNPS